MSAISTLIFAHTRFGDRCEGSPVCSAAASANFRNASSDGNQAVRYGTPHPRHRMSEKSAMCSSGPSEAAAHNAGDHRARDCYILALATWSARGMNIASATVDELAQRLAQLTGEDVETALERAIEERLSRVAIAAPADRLTAMRIFFDRVSSLPVKDPRPIDEIAGYGPSRRSWRLSGNKRYDNKSLGRTRNGSNRIHPSA
jgi:hypothetical protein